jgi:hypothetical protein
LAFRPFEHHGGQNVRDGQGARARAPDTDAATQERAAAGAPAAADAEPDAAAADPAAEPAAAAAASEEPATAAADPTYAKMCARAERFGLRRPERGAALRRGPQEHLRHARQRPQYAGQPQRRVTPLDGNQFGIASQIDGMADLTGVKALPHMA